MAEDLNTKAATLSLMKSNIEAIVRLILYIIVIYLILKLFKVPLP